MAVQTTESQIPGGFNLENAELLGQANISTNKKYALVSYLSSPLRKGKEEKKNYIRNTYVVFVDTKNNAEEPSKYIWKLEFFTQGNDNSFYAINKNTENGIFHLDTSEIVELKDQDISKLNVIVELVGVSVSIPTMTQEVKELIDAIEALFGDDNGDNVARGGNPETTRLLANDYDYFSDEGRYLFSWDSVPGDDDEKFKESLRNYFDIGWAENAEILKSDDGKTIRIFKDENSAEIIINETEGKATLKISNGRTHDLKVKKENDKLNIYEGSTPKNLVASVIYLHLLNNSYESQQENLEYWEAYINDNNKKPDALKKIPLGIAHIRPQLLAMLLGKFPGEEIKKWNEENVNREKYEKQVFELFDTNVSKTDKIDIFNWLRFPLSSIKQCGDFLNRLKNEHTIWENSSLEDLIDDRECIQTIVSEYKRGPCTTKILHDLTEIGEKVFDTMFTPYIEKIVAKEYIQYEMVKIKVLDIRSGKPVQNAKIKKLFVRGSDGKTIGVNGEDVFLFDREKITVEENKLVRAAQIALLRLGYAPAPVDRTNLDNEKEDTGWCDNVWGKETSEAYNSYWADRIPDKPPQAGKEKKDKPDSSYLRKIKDEYNCHAYTDSTGVVKVKIPKVFLDDRKVSIDIGFWEFPIVLEELEDDERDDPICRSDETVDESGGAPTNFEISWIGDTPGNNQEADWDTYLEDGQYQENVHFGWNVKNAELENESNLKVWQRLIVKDDADEFEEFDDDLLSIYYDNTGDHFVLFGMQWCQPVWDEFPIITTPWIRGEVGTATTAEYLPDRMALLAIITRWDALPNRSGMGRDFGTLILNPSATSPRGIRPHHGIDYHAVEGISSVFALHGGVIDSVNKGTNKSNGYGNKIDLLVNYNGKHFIRLAHLHDLPAITVNTNDYVMSGYKFGTAGRTFNWTNPDTGNVHPTYTTAPTHLHLEISLNTIVNRINNPKNIFANNDPHLINSIIILNNDSYRLFPCHCHGGKGPGSDCAIHGGNNGTLFISSHCWASRNLHCPYLFGRFRSKAQLTYLYEDTRNTGPVPYLRPGNTENDKIVDTWDNSDKAAIRRFREKHRNEIYDTYTEPPAGDAEWEAEPIDYHTWRVLNSHAPYPRTDFTRVDQ